jgi:hypothetical protein
MKPNVIGRTTRCMVKTTDVYEGSWYLLNGCKMGEVHGKERNGEISCEMFFTGADIVRLYHEYQNGTAAVNLAELRRIFDLLNYQVLKEKYRCKYILRNGGKL